MRSWPSATRFGAFHVASFWLHPEFQARDSDVAGVVLVSGLYRLSADASAAEKSYFWHWMPAQIR